MFDYEKLKDPRFFKEHVIAAHSDHVAYPNRECMEQGENPFRHSLNGLWKFSYARNLNASVSGYESPDVDCHDWEEIRVPAHIQMEGYDAPAYVNTQYPWDGREQIWTDGIPTRFNPVANYVKYFTVPEFMQNKPLYISFQGVESGMIVWLNGQYVGYSEDSFTPSEFELTPYVTEGENKLAVQVFKWTSGSWAEDQDFYRFSGIFRDVYLYTVPAVHVWDMKICTLLDDTYTNAEVTVDVACQGEGSVEAALTAYENNGRRLDGAGQNAGGKISAPDGGSVCLTQMKEGMARLAFSIEHPLLWSAEQPNLYRLSVTVRDAGGKITEEIEEKVGVRRFELIDRVMCLNGKRLVFKGVNRHEFSSVCGRVPCREELLRDLVTMKQNNINAIRTSHYPNDAALYHLCDELGFYLIAENNMETHGTLEAWQQGKIGLEDVVPGDRPEWREAMLDRVNSMYQRDKNRPSILIWSCGNESCGGRNIYEMSQKFRALDNTRLVHYEGIYFDRRYNESSDIESQMYTPVEKIREFLKEHRDKPFICCEYAHAMGNSCGAMHKYTELTETEELYQGGFIWDYVDQSIYKKNRYGEEFQAYGGDFGERPTDYNFSGNGIVYGGDRAPSPKMQEVKFNYQNISAEVSREKVKIINRHLFLHTDAYDCVVTVERNGKELAKCPMATDVPPLSEKEYVLADVYAKLGLSDRLSAGEYAVTVSFSLKEDTDWAKKGHEIAFGQGVFCVKDEPKESASEQKRKPVTVTEGKWNIGVRGDHFEALFSYLNGGLASYRYGGVELLESIPMPNFWRAPIDNDEGSMMKGRYAQWKIASMYISHKDFETCAWERPLLEERDGCAIVTYTYHMPTVPVSSCKVRYRVSGDGCVEVTLLYDPVKELRDMPEFGMMMKINADYDHLEWYGMGPQETYADRCHGAKLGIYRSLVAENVARYLVPQECGNKTGVRWARVCDRRGRGLLFESEDMSFSALPWTPHEMENARHPYELPPVHYTVVRAAKAQMGVGGDNSWGARTHPEYLLDVSKPMEFTFRFRGI